MGMTKKELLKRLPRGMRTAHRHETNAFIRESIRAWEAADETGRRDIMAFYDCDGPAKIMAMHTIDALQRFLGRTA